LAKNNNPTLVAIFWTILIATSCLIPASAFKPFSFNSFLQIDKIIHLILFFCWVTFWLLSKHKIKKLTLKIKGQFLFLGILYGILIEFLQSSMHLGRSFEIDDMIANGVGALIGVLTIDYVINHFSFFKKYVPLVKYLYPHL